MLRGWSGIGPLRRARSNLSSWKQCLSILGASAHSPTGPFVQSQILIECRLQCRPALHTPLSLRGLSASSRGPSSDGTPSTTDGLQIILDLKRWLVQTRYGRLMRIDKPTGTHLLFLPAAWGITMGTESIVDALSLYTLFYTGAVLLRGAGCTINDIWDADIDPHVDRTKDRPIAAGEISIPAAFAFLSAQLACGLAVLLSLNQTSFIVGAPIVIPVMLYPLAKRTTRYPQAVLGLTFNWGALLGYAAAADTLSASAFCLYGAGWCWTLVYDTIYAHQDKKDDALIGVQSSALALGNSVRPVLSGLVIAKIGCLALAGALADLGTPYYAGITIAGAHSLKQVWWTNLDDPKQCLMAFNSSGVTGAIIWAAVVSGRLL
jgi:4-hydroxybenzoate polyprenyltransferase